MCKVPNSSDRYPTKDESEVLKPFIEISKYVMTVTLGMISIFTLLTRSTPQIEWHNPVNIFVAVIGILLSGVSILSANRVAAEATDWLTKKSSSENFDEGVVKLRKRSYSVLAISFISSIFYWLVVFLVIAIGF